MLQKYLLSFILISIFNFSFSQDCTSVVSTVNNGNIQIVFFSENGECFKAKLINQYLFPGFSNQITFLESDGMKKMKIEMESGEVIEKTIAINAEYKKAMFQISKNKKGDYKLKLLPFQTTTNGPTATELMAKAEKDLEDFVTKAEREEQERIKKELEKEKLRELKEKNRLAEIEREKAEQEQKEAAAERLATESKSNSSSGNSSITSNGSTKVRLKIVYNNASGMKINIGYKGNIIGSGTTDGNGFVNIYTNSLVSKNIDVYGESDGGTWSMEGFTRLDDNNYAEVDPTQAIGKMLDTFEKIYNIDDQSDEEIMDMFGQ